MREEQLLSSNVYFGSDVYGFEQRRCARVLVRLNRTDCMHKFALRIIRLTVVSATWSGRHVHQCDDQVDNIPAFPSCKIMVCSRKNDNNDFVALMATLAGVATLANSTWGLLAI